MSADVKPPVPAISFALEDDLASKLEPAPSDAVSNNVAGERVATVRIKLQIGELTANCIIDINVGNSQPLVIEKIERLGLELERNALADSGVLEHGHVHGTDGLAALR